VNWGTLEIIEFSLFIIVMCYATYQMSKPLGGGRSLSVADKK
jgi:hypothetical protein